MAKDLFSTHSNEYANFRPTYPTELIEYIVSFVKERDIAWDCATGNGQAAILLVDHFKKVLATDLSKQQLSVASIHPAIEYSIAEAESTVFPDRIFDLITVSQAYHWLDHRRFADEAHRVGKPGAIVAIWGYNLLRSSNPEVIKLIDEFYHGETKQYWEPERKYLDDNYLNTPFYFNEISVNQSFKIKTMWTVEQLKGYFNTWSAVIKFINSNSFNPVVPLMDKIIAAWGNESKLQFEFPIALRIGKL